MSVSFFLDRRLAKKAKTRSRSTLHNSSFLCTDQTVDLRVSDPRQLTSDIFSAESTCSLEQLMTIKHIMPWILGTLTYASKQAQIYGSILALGLKLNLLTTTLNTANSFKIIIRTELCPSNIFSIPKEKSVVGFLMWNSPICNTWKVTDCIALVTYTFLETGQHIVQYFNTRKWRNRNTNDSITNCYSYIIAIHGNFTFFPPVFESL